MSDGTVGWAISNLIVLNAQTAAIMDEAVIYKRPDLLTITDKKFDKMEMVAIKDTSDDWIEVVGNQNKKTGWIKSKMVTENPEDVAVAILARKKIYKNNDIDTRKIEEFISTLPYKNQCRLVKL